MVLIIRRWDYVLSYYRKSIKIFEIIEFFHVFLKRIENTIQIYPNNIIIIFGNYGLLSIFSFLLLSTVFIKYETSGILTNVISSSLFTKFLSLLYIKKKKKRTFLHFFKSKIFAFSELIIIILNVYMNKILIRFLIHKNMFSHYQ